MLYKLRFFSSKCCMFHKANLFGPCIIHIVLTGCAEIKKKFVQKSLMYFFRKINNMHQCAKKQSAVSV